MRLFISEFVCGGQWPEPELDASLAIEGQSMLRALLRDAAQIPELDVVTSWDHRLGTLTIPGIEIQITKSQQDAADLFEQLAAEADVTLLVAPELDGLLTHRALLAEGLGSRLCGPSPAAISQCADKHLLAELLQESGVPVIPTYEFWVGRTADSEISFPAVVKPRDGAGSQETYLVRTAAEFSTLEKIWNRSSLLSQAIWQPYISGRAVSVGLLISPEQYRFEALPVCEQTLSGDGRFQYQGGVLPARDIIESEVQQVAIQACRAVPGLRGYVGVDLIIPDHPGATPVVVEINPRVTTSYLAYSSRCESNLLERWLNPERTQEPLVWKTGRISYTASGAITLIN